MTRDNKPKPKYNTRQKKVADKKEKKKQKREKNLEKLKKKRYKKNGTM